MDKSCKKQEERCSEGRWAGRKERVARRILIGKGARRLGKWRGGDLKGRVFGWKWRVRTREGAGGKEL